MGAGAGGGEPSQPHVLNAKTKHAQKKLGPILGPVTKEKIIDRFKGYAVCGIKAEPQKQTLILRHHQLIDESYVVEVECFFLGVQGLFEYFHLKPKDGTLTPLSFDGAQPALQKINKAEPKSPVGINQGRHEVCGVPQLKLPPINKKGINKKGINKKGSKAGDSKGDAPQSVQLTTLCKGNGVGTCGAYAEYQLDTQRGTFTLKTAHFLSCASPSKSPPREWPTIRL